MVGVELSEFHSYRALRLSPDVRRYLGGLTPMKGKN